jgi:hypothetical protein
LTEKKSIEEILLAGETPLQTIAAALGKSVSFNQGKNPGPGTGGGHSKQDAEVAGKAASCSHWP